jgi:acyl-CoA thioesterase
MLFSEVLDALVIRGGGGTVSVPDDWMQGRSVFGGLQTAIALRAMQSLLPEGFPLRVLQTTFVSPVDGAVRVKAALLRTGKGTIHAEARLFAGDETAALVVGVFGKGRSSKVVVVPRAPEFVAHPAPIDLPSVPGATPAFTQHFGMRWLAGWPPFAASPETTAVIEVSMRDRPPVGDAHVVAIADSPPPVALSMLSDFSPGSSVTWTIEMVGEGFTDLSLEGWRLHTEVRAGRDGYTSQHVAVCAPGGAVAALSSQTMMVFG